MSLLDAPMARITPISRYVPEHVDAHHTIQSQRAERLGIRLAITSNEVDENVSLRPSGSG